VGRFVSRRAKATAASGAVAVVGLVGALVLIAIGPYLAGEAVGGAAVGWAFECAYLALIAASVAAWRWKARRDAARWEAEQEARAARAALAEAARAAERASRAAARAEREAELEAARARLRSTGEPFYDTALRAFSHGKCTIRHRTEGAAARCRADR